MSEAARCIGVYQQTMFDQHHQVMMLLVVVLLFRSPIIRHLEQTSGHIR
jgi:hypothetical protein